MTEYQYRTVNTFFVYGAAIVATMLTGLLSRAMHDRVSVFSLLGDVDWLNLFGFSCLFQLFLFVHGVIYLVGIKKAESRDGWSEDEHQKRFHRFYKACVPVGFIGMILFGIAVRVL